MTGKDKEYNQNVMGGCGLLALIVMIALGALMIRAFTQDRQAAQYPGSTVVSAHNNYTGLPYHFRWDNTYRTTDAFAKVYNWYSTGFDLGAEARANGECILLEGSRKQLTMERQTTVLLCDTPTGPMIFVSRSTSLK
jgi:hypothetical protein